MEVPYVVGGLALAVGVWVLVSYNRFVEQRNLIRDSWSNVETELQRRYDLIPNLVETVRGYATHEQRVLVAVTDARARAESNHGDPAAQAADENLFVAALRQLFAVAEAYPELRASRHFLELQSELTDTEDRIQAARRFYNANVREWNRRIQSVPSNVVAGVFSFREEQYFQVEPTVREAGAPSTSF
ncbi:MAG: LemA family protein [Actinobacteria bacterium]|nr:LemA family protein [Actinomycetota bacterium]